MPEVNGHPLRTADMRAESIGPAAHIEQDRSLPATRSPSLSPPSRLAAQAGLIASAVLAVLLTLATIQASYRTFRLASLPTWDDVGALREAAQWVPIFYDHGLDAVLTDYIAHPPRGPYTAILAFIAFVLFGIHEWAPYTTTALQTFFLLAFCNHLLASLGTRRRIACLILVATVPILAVGAAEFKTDYVAAFFTGFGIVLALRKPFTESDLRNQAAVGAMFGLALFSKPSIFAVTGILYTAAMVLAPAADRLSGERRPTVPSVLRAWAVAALATLVIAGPQFALDGPRLWEYMWTHIFGSHRDLWVVEGSMTFHALFYLTGPGGRTILGNHLFLFGAAMLVAAVITAARGGRVKTVRSAALGVMLILTYLVPTLNEIKSHLLGLAFQTLVVLLGIMSLRVLLLTEAPPAPPPPTTARRRPPWASILLAVFTLAGVLSFEWRLKWHPFYTDDPARPPVEARRALVEDLLTVVIERSPRRTPVIARVSGPGDINYDSLHFLAVQRGVTLRVLEHETSNPDDYAPMIQQADFVIAAQSGTGMVLEVWGSSTIQDEMLDRLRRRSDFAQVADYTAPGTDRHIVLFQAVRPGDGFGPFRGADGLHPVEGPHPQWEMPFVHWSKGPATTLHIETPGGAPATLVMRCMTHQPTRTIRVLLDGRELATLGFVLSHEWHTFTTPLGPLSPGVHQLRLEYATPTPDDRPGQGVLFRSLRIAPDAPGPNGM